MKWVKISNEKPPSWILAEVKEKFGVDWNSNVIFTYEDLITTSTGEMTEDLIAHEQTHTRQQLEFVGGADAWWRKYLDDPEFRFKQELEAYRNQYEWLIKNIKDRNEVSRFLMHYAKTLSGKMYGNMVDFGTAMTMIKNGDK